MRYKLYEPIYYPKERGVMPGNEDEDYGLSEYFGAPTEQDCNDLMWGDDDE